MYSRVHSGRVRFSQPLEVIMDLAGFYPEGECGLLGETRCSVSVCDRECSQRAGRYVSLLSQPSVHTPQDLPQPLTRCHLIIPKPRPPSLHSLLPLRSHRNHGNPLQLLLFQKCLRQLVRAGGPQIGECNAPRSCLVTKEVQAYFCIR